MPIPSRKAGEPKDEFIGRSVAKLKGEYPDDQAAAICYEQLSFEDPNSSNIYNQVKQQSPTKMTNLELKELVKKHFSLVEAPVAEAFGELKDINGAFTLKFPGDTLGR